MPVAAAVLVVRILFKVDFGACDRMSAFVRTMHMMHATTQQRMQGHHGGDEMSDDTLH